jgi:GAF domain-containing protein
MPVLLLCEPRANGAAHPAGGVPLLPRPRRLGTGVPAAALEDAADQVRRAIAAWLERARPARPRPAAPMPGPALEDLRHVSRRLRDPTTRGEVMALVLDFAARCFARVAIFMVRDGKAVGMAQRGLPGAGGPDDAELRRIQLPLSGPGGPACFRRAIGRRAPCVARADDPGDRGLLALLGDPVPAEAWVAPIESGGGVAALLYADNVPRPLPLADATALEIVLQEAGLALDRALLERALADLEGRRDGA